MILPNTYLTALLVLIFSTLCAGSWINTLKMAGKWRFELYYYDFSLGAALCAGVIAFTLGMLNSHELTFQDNLLIAGYHKILYCFAAGVVFNLANMLLTGATSASGMAVSFPISFGLALAIGSVWNFATNPQGSTTLLFGGVLLVVASVLIAAFAYSGQLDALAAAAVATPEIDPRSKRAPKRKTAAPGIALSVFSGIVMGLFSPLVEMGREGDNGVGPYGLGLLFASGIFFSTILYNPFFLNFPVSGQPIHAIAYLKGSLKQHFLGLLGGGIWAAGAIGAFAVAFVPGAHQAGPALTFGISQAVPIVAVLWGLTVWKEFAGATDRVRMLLVAMIAIFLVGVGVISVSH